MEIILDCNIMDKIINVHHFFFTRVELNLRLQHF